MQIVDQIGNLREEDFLMKHTILPYKGKHFFFYKSARVEKLSPG